MNVSVQLITFSLDCVNLAKLPSTEHVIDFNYIICEKTHTTLRQQI